MTDGSRPAAAPSAARASLVAGIALVSLLACATATSAEAERIVEVLGLRAGSVVADVGAGDGEWSVPLAEAVGEEGRVFATEVDEELLGVLRDLAAREELRQVTVVAGDQRRTGLPEGCCDAILLRMVYHHFTDPEVMRADLARALRPGGRLAVIDIVPQADWRHLPDVPDRGGHGVAPSQLVAEMEADGWTVIERIDAWNGDEERYCVVFGRGTETADRPPQTGDR